MGETHKTIIKDEDLLTVNDTAIAGGVAGALTAIATNPLDVARTRAQVQPTLKGMQYNGMLSM